MVKQIPAALSGVILPFDWDVRLVWALSAQTQLISRAELDPLLYLPLWSSVPEKGMLFDVEPITVISDPDASPHQTARLAKTDMTYPIDLLEFESRTWILDGVHRLAKHYQCGNSSVEVRVHDASVIEKIRVLR